MIERKIIIALITDKQFTERIIEEITKKPSKYLQAQRAKTIARWCEEYFNKYKTVPGKNIEDIYYAKLKAGLNKETAEEIEELLTDLSEEYTQKNNNDFLFDEAKKYFIQRKNEIFLEELQTNNDNNDFEEFNKNIETFKPFENNKINISDYMQTLEQMKADPSPKHKLLLKPWLRCGECSLLYADYGVGKTLLAILIGYLLGLKDYDNEDAKIGDWEVKNPTGTVYIDGEMGRAAMQERIESFEWIGKQDTKRAMKCLSIPEMQIKTNTSFSLSQRKNQKIITNWFKENENYKLLIIDSVSTCFELDDENSNSEWNKKINPLLKDLRALGVACIIQHHSGKNGTLRGASAQGTMMYNIFYLKNIANKEFGVANFSITNKKQRTAGKFFKPFTIRFELDEFSKETTWEVDCTNSNYKNIKDEQINIDIIEGMKNKDISEKYKISTAAVSQRKNKIKKKGFINENGDSTKLGLEYINKCNMN